MDESDRTRLISGTCLWRSCFKKREIADPTTSKKRFRVSWRWKNAVL